MKKYLFTILRTVLISFSLVSFAGVALWAAPAGRDSCVSPAAPVLSGSARSLCRGDSATLLAGNCAGTVVWSTGQTGSRIGVRPQQTTRYTAICRAPLGCVSCYAEVWTLTVQTPEPPALSASAGLLCADDAVTLTATNCPGTVVWADGSTGTRLTDHPRLTTSYTAYCQSQTCRSNPARPLSVQITTPAVPTVQTDQSEVCAGQSVRLWATGCVGTVRWTDGQAGAERLVQPMQSIRYRAVCQVGSCVSDSSAVVAVSVRPDVPPFELRTALANDCPYQTVNLARALTDAPGGYMPAWGCEFRTGPSLLSPAVQSVGAVTAGTYYIFQRTSEGCVRGPVAVRVTVNACRNAIAPCLTDPAGVAVRLDTLDRRAGMIRLAGLLRGSAGTAHWQTTGTGLFTDSSRSQARYLVSDTDRQRGRVTFALTTADPDGPGPCTARTASLSVAIPAVATGTVAGLGLSKQALEPVWINHETVSLTYRLTVRNDRISPDGTDLQQLQVSDNLEPGLLAAGVRIGEVAVRTDSSWTLNPAYTGQGADTTLLLADLCTLPAGTEKYIYLTINANVGRANTLTFSNVAYVQARTATGEIYADQSTTGTDPDPDHNHDPTDNREPTVLTVPSVSLADAGTLFVPEGFSPNGDGINDRLVIRGIPAGQTLLLTVYNRWGQAVFQQTSYDNAWDGTTGAGRPLPDGTYFYVARLSDGQESARFLTLSR